MEEEFIKVYEKYKNDIYRLCFSYTKNFSIAEDITQNVFIKFYKNMLKVDKEVIKNWLVKVTINECKSYYLSSWYKKTTYIDDESKLKQEIINNDKLLEELLLLPKKERLVIHLYYYENYKINEISMMLKLSESNIKVLMHRARKKLKDLLEESYEQV